MDKEIILSKYKKPEEKLLISKFLDKLEQSKKQNKIETTDFYNELEQNIIKKIISIIGIKNCVLYGGYDSAERKIVVIFPEKMKNIFEENNFKYETVMSAFRITIPKESKDFYNHRVYLGGVLKLGIKREKVGDIIITETGADIIVKKETEKFLYTNLNTLTRFSSVQLKNIALKEILSPVQKFKEYKIVTSSLRLDNIISELAKTSRNKAAEILNAERVFINYENETKNTKQVLEGDVISIRGRGKFIISEIAGNTKKGNYIIIIKEYI